VIITGYIVVNTIHLSDYSYVQTSGKRGTLTVDYINSLGCHWANSTKEFARYSYNVSVGIRLSHKWNNNKRSVKKTLAIHIFQSNCRWFSCKIFI